MKAFICYKREDEDHNRWVEKFATDLRLGGIDALLDRWEVKLGESFSDYMTRSINTADAVLFVMTASSIQAVEECAPHGGAVKFEFQMATARKIAGEKFRLIGILRQGERTAKQLRDSCYADFRKDETYREMLKKLVEDLIGFSEKPPLLNNYKDIFRKHTQSIKPIDYSAVRLTD